MLAAKTSSPPVVLLVDDVPEFRLVATLLGRRHGYECLTCEDVPSAWAVMQERHPDLLLLDQNLPGEHGLELLRRMRADTALTGIPVALFVQMDLHQDIVKGLQAGATFAVAKDLISQPVLWLQRLREILAYPDGRFVRRSVSFTKSRDLPVFPTDFLTVLKQAIRQGPLRQLGLPVLQLLLQRAVSELDLSGTIPPEGMVHWLVGDNLHPGNVDVESTTIKHPNLLAASLFDQVWCLLGTEGTNSFRTALLALLPALSENQAVE